MKTFMLLITLLVTSHNSFAGSETVYPLGDDVMWSCEDPNSLDPLYHTPSVIEIQYRKSNFSHANIVIATSGFMRPAIQSTDSNTFTAIEEDGYKVPQLVINKDGTGIFTTDINYPRSPRPVNNCRFNKNAKEPRN